MVNQIRSTAISKHIWYQYGCSNANGHINLLKITIIILITIVLQASELAKPFTSMS